MDLIHGNPHALLLGIAEAARGNQWKGDRTDPFLSRQSQAFPVAGPKQVLLPAPAVIIQRAYRMDDISGGKPEAGSHEDFPFRNRAYVFFSVGKLFPAARGLIDCMVTSGAYSGLIISSIDDGFGMHSCYIVAHNFKWHRPRSF